MIPLSDRIPTRRVPVVTMTLVLINVLVFLYEQWLLASGGERELERFIMTYGLVPARVAAGGLSPDVLLTFVTSIFLHGGWLHLIGNMLYLWIFGNNIEDTLGHSWYVLFYLATGLAANFAQLIFSWGSSVPGVGASGAIAGVLGAYLIYFPGSRVNTLIFLGMFATIRALPALVVLGFWFIIQLFQGVASFGMTETGGVAYFAHIGGFIAGIVLGLPWLMKARRERSQYS